MKKIFITCIIFFAALNLSAQIKLREGFETTAPGNLPSGWTVYNRAAFPILPRANWYVRDTGSSVIGIQENFLTKSKSGIRSIGVSWFASQDTTMGTNPPIADAWLVSPQINVSAGDSLRFFASGGNEVYLDSLQIWISTINNNPVTFTNKVSTIKWLSPSLFGEYKRFAFGLSSYTGQNIWIAFRYYLDNTEFEGFFVQLDDIAIGQPVDVKNISSNIPDKFSLSQNYPNPFNPETKINFSIAKNSESVSLKIYDIMGREMETLVNEKLNSGEYSLKFNGTNYSSGIYYYTLRTNEFTETKKMNLIR